MSVSSGTPPGALAPCDFIGARRTRRTFRLLAAAFFLFTLVLWFSEGYLRYGISETQYRMSRTLLPEQARPILRNLVERESKSEEGVSARYLEALAFVESSEEQLPLYEKAYQANPRSVSLLMSYGACLYETGQFEEAREKFREAGITPPRSILPRFLEAAALAAASDSSADPADVIALITRANASGDPVRFPAPLWHDDLPQRGSAYMQARYAIDERYCAILEDLAEHLFSKIQESIRTESLQDWDMWLQSIQEMGKRLFGDENVENTPATLVQMMTALRIELESVSLREKLSELSGGAADSALVDKRLRLESAIRALMEFELEKPRLISEHYSRLLLPFQLLLEWFVSFLVFYIFAFLIHRIGSGGKRARAAPHIAAGKWAPAVGLTVLMALLLVQNLPVFPMASTYAPLLWRSLLGVMLGFGLIYPVLMVRYCPFLEDVFEWRTGAKTTPGTKKDRSIPLRKYVGVYGCLARRYISLLIMGALMTACGWLLVERALHGAYPFEFELRATGLEQEEQSLQAALWDYLQPPQEPNQAAD